MPIYELLTGTVPHGIASIFYKEFEPLFPDLCVNLAGGKEAIVMAAENLDEFLRLVRRLVQFYTKFKRHNLIISAIDKHYRTMNVPDIIDCFICTVLFFKVT